MECEYLAVYWKRFGKQKAPTEVKGVACRSTHVLKRTWPLITVDKLSFISIHQVAPVTALMLLLLSQEDQPQTHHSTRQIFRETGLICDLLRSWPVLCGVSEKSLCAQTDAAIISFTYINVSQGSVATQFRWGEIINNPFIASFPQSMPVKEFLKSVNIWRRYGRKYGDMFFDSRCSIFISTKIDDLECPLSESQGHWFFIILANVDQQLCMLYVIVTRS